MQAIEPPFLILLPKPGTYAATAIADGSGVVGVESAPGKLTVSYEGNLYDAVNLRNWSDRVIHAADRLRTGYPTSARGIFPAQDFQIIGTVQPYQGKLLVCPPGFVP